MTTTAIIGTVDKASTEVNIMSNVGLSDTPRKRWWSSGTQPLAARKMCPIVTMVEPDVGLKPRRIESRDTVSPLQ